MEDDTQNLNQSPKVILFLGAGASSFAGYHTFVSFPELLFNNEIRKDENMPPLSSNISRILKAIKESLERNNKPTTHDNFLWRLDSYTNLLRLNQSDDVLQDFLRENTRLYDLFICTDQAINQISNTTVHHYSLNRVQKAKQNDNITYEKMKSVFEFYKELANFNTNYSLPIFTTNYDLFLEDLIKEFSGINNFLVNGISNNTDEETFWSPDFYLQIQGLQLYRLHGCVNWFYHTREDNNVYFHRKNAVFQEMGKLCAMYPGRETKIGMNPHGLAFKTLYSSLTSCDLAVFIGFSFRDDDVMHVFLKALSEREGEPKILVVDPLYNSLDVQHRLEDSATRSAFPSKIPNDKQINSIKAYFGEDKKVLQKIIKKCNIMLQT
jgi:hypothetical protein